MEGEGKSTGSLAADVVAKRLAKEKAEKPEPSPEDGAEDVGLEACVEDMFDAFQGGDRRQFLVALKSAFKQMR